MGVMLGEPTGKYWSYVKRLKKLPSRCWIDTNLLTPSLVSLPANVCVWVKASTVPAAILAQTIDTIAVCELRRGFALQCFHYSSCRVCVCV